MILGLGIGMLLGFIIDEAYNYIHAKKGYIEVFSTRYIIKSKQVMDWVDE